MNLISKGKAVDLLKNEADTHCLPEYKEAYIRAASIIACMPNEEDEPVKHGRWLLNGMILNRQKCSVCGFYSDDLQADNYCPNCGAQMTSNEQEEKR